MKSRIREAILAVVPADGSRIGNISLVREVLEAAAATGEELAEDDVQAVREELIAEGVLGKGRGRGGSVYRLDGGGEGWEAPTKRKSTGKKKPAKKQRRSHQEAPAGDSGPYGSYKHADEATLRPDVGVQDQFSQHRKPKTYRYDSSLAPELAWDENAEREYAEWLLALVTEAAEKGEARVFAEPQQWKGTGERFRSTGECVARLKSLTRPFLNWAGKAERQQISVPTVPLFVHERHSTRAILEKLKSYKASGQNLDLFGDPEVDIADRLDAYEHKGPWTNRMILGDSLQVMNSLLEYEGLGGQVQMIYIDPPYGVKFGSNFQPFVRKRDMGDKHGKDEWMSREPEMVKAYRDTWELGLHSYLNYLRDRLMLARELLTKSGSVFVQISDENLHHVREVIDEIFGASNFCGLIAFRTTGGQSSALLSGSTDYLIWSAKSREHARNKFKQPTIPKIAEGEIGAGQYVFVEPEDGSQEPRKMTKDELSGAVALPKGWRVLSHDTLYSQGAPSDPEEQSFEWRGRIYRCPANTHWKPGVKSGGMQRLADAGRIMLIGNTLRYKRYVDDFSVKSIDNVWNDTARSGFARKKEYVVETSEKVVERCLLMTTDPGDLVFDPTCGSGTTAYVAEQWGRRWITCDTSRVPLALARQKVLTAKFHWYELKDPDRGPAGGFTYKRKQNRKGEEVGGLVPRITLSSIANNEEPDTFTLVDRPEKNTKVTRVCGPFAVEATIQAAVTLDEDVAGETAVSPAGYENPRTYLDRMIEVLRRAHNLSLPGNVTLALDSVRPVADCEWLHAEARTETNGNGTKRVAVAFGPEHGAISSQFVYEAAREAHFLKYDQLYLFGFAIQAKARAMVEDRAKLRIPCSYVHVTPDVVMSDLLKTSHTDQIFSITGLPDVTLRKVGKGEDGQPLHQVELQGLDIFRPDTLETESVAAENLPCWMLDTDYNGMVFCASQVFFPRTGAWDNLQKSLKAEFDDSVWDHLAGTESEPFVLGENRRVAVKVIDERGNELMVVRGEDEVEK